MKFLKESSELSKGIFWVKDVNNIRGSIIYFGIPCDTNGNATNNFVSNAKSGTTYNHENTWKLLSSKLTHNKPFDYFPRGRVEVNNSKAIIYCSPYLYSNELKNTIIELFNLNNHNGIRSVRMIADGSKHYQCYLDKE